MGLVRPCCWHRTRLSCWPDKSLAASRCGDREAIRVLLATRAQAVTFRTRPSRPCMRWLPALLTLFASGSGGCRWDSCCKPAPGCATPRDEASRSPPPCWLCGPPHAGRWPAGGRRTRGPARPAGPSAPPELLGQLGIGPVVAGQVITSWSHHGRIRSEAAFAKLGGAAPIEALSGPLPGTD